MNNYSVLLSGMKRLTMVCFAIVMALMAIAESESRPWITREPNGTYDVIYSVKGRVEGGVIAEYLRYEPIPDSSVYQEITWKQMPPSHLIAVNKQTGDRYLRLEGTNAKEVPSVTLSFTVTFFKVKVDFSKIGKLYPYDKTKAEYKFYTRTTAEEGEDAVGRFKKWKDTEIPWIRRTSRRLLNDAKGDVLAYVKSAYELVSEEFEYYADDAPGIHPRNLLQSVESKRGHCGLRHSVFVTLLRAAGIPARLVNCNRPSQSPHVWAEFYLETYGWLPVNLARKAGEFSHFGMYDEHCIILTKDQKVVIKSKSGKLCMLGQTRGQWHWKANGKNGKPIFEFKIQGTKRK